MCKRKLLLLVPLTFAVHCAYSACFGESCNNEHGLLKQPHSNAGQVPDKQPYLPESIKHYNQAVELHRSGSINRAIAEYKTAVDIDGRLLEAWFNLGRIFAAQKSYGEAIEAYNKVLNIERSLPPTHSGRFMSFAALADVYQEQGNCAKAEELYREALSMNDKGLGMAYPTPCTTMRHYYAEQKDQQRLKNWKHALKNLSECKNQTDTNMACVFFLCSETE